MAVYYWTTTVVTLATAMKGLLSSMCVIRVARAKNVNDEPHHAKAEALVSLIIASFVWIHVAVAWVQLGAFESTEYSSAPIVAPILLSGYWILSGYAMTLYTRPKPSVYTPPCGHLDANTRPR